MYLIGNCIDGGLQAWVLFAMLPQFAAAVHSFLLGWYFLGEAFDSMYFILGGLTIISIVYGNTTLAWNVAFKSVLSRLLLPWR